MPLLLSSVYAPTSIKALILLSLPSHYLLCLSVFVPDNVQTGLQGLIADAGRTENLTIQQFHDITIARLSNCPIVNFLDSRQDVEVAQSALSQQELVHAAPRGVVEELDDVFPLLRHFEVQGALLGG